MPRFDGTGPQAQGSMAGRRRGGCERATLSTNGDLRCGLRLRRRGQGKGNCSSFRLVGANKDSHFVQSCIERLQSEIQSMQARLDRLKTSSGR